ncbi:MAG: DUF2156 domain-containing protein [Bacillota bacterium]
MDFTRISLAAHEPIKEFTDVWQLELSDLSFANMFIWRYSHNIEYCIENDVLYIKLCHRRFPCFFFVPLTLNRQRSIRGPLDRLREYTDSIGEPLRVKSATVEQKAKIEQDCPDMFDFTYDEGRFDYVYNTRDLIELKGKKYHGKRNHINRFMSLYNYAYATLEPGDVEECIGVYTDWVEKKGIVGLDVEDEWRSVTEALYHFEQLRLKGGVIRVDGAIQAFTLGEQLTRDTALIHIEKGNTECEGIFAMMNRAFAEAEFSHTLFINREEDLGIEGLRKAKRSYRPVKMIEKYDLKVKGETRE